MGRPGLAISSRALDQRAPAKESLARILLIKEPSGRRPALIPPVTLRFFPHELARVEGEVAGESGERDGPEEFEGMPACRRRRRSPKVRRFGWGRPPGRCEGRVSDV